MDISEVIAERTDSVKRPPARPRERAGEVLIVDLDDTLVRTDMLYETFWSALATDWRVAFGAARAFAGGGRAALKHYLARSGSVEPDRLPYNVLVIDRVTRWRIAGGRTALVTATDQHVAEKIAAHLGLFDEVHGSDGRRNLKGETKARFLAERFTEGFHYLGDSDADIAIWRRSLTAVTVDVPAALRARVDALGVVAEHIATPVEGEGRGAVLLRTLRPHQWLKNVLVFVPMLTAHALTATALLQSALAFVAFSLFASSAYVLNDLLDLQADRAHPRKRTRPLASGKLPLATGTLLAPALLVAGMLVAASLGVEFLLVMLGYFVATLSYSLYLKRQALLDICVLAGLYTARIVAGGVAVTIPLSVWLLAFSVFFFFSLAAVKRQAELADNLARGRGGAVGRAYVTEDLPLVTTMALAAGYVSVLVMALYVNSVTALELYGHPSMLWGICAVLLYWISRMVMVTHRGGMHDDPIVYAVKDPGSRVCFALIGLCALLGASG